ncbi:hypothetical protein [Pelagibius sp. 7325]|uniref:hypothetical protein n=1 Tax=Pelagibius sp. 7325 TaxID=3131994 RepID=UPI0030EC23F7
MTGRLQGIFGRAAGRRCGALCCRRQTATSSLTKIRGTLLAGRVAGWLRSRARVRHALTSRVRTDGRSRGDGDGEVMVGVGFQTPVISQEIYKKPVKGLFVWPNIALQQGDLF